MRAQSVLFVCLGNICRSPLAEGALRAAADERGTEVIVESAGTSDWHVGSEPDRRAQAIAARNGINISRLRARQVRPDDFMRFDHIVAMDAENLAHMRAIMPEGARARLSMLLDHVPGREGQAVTDPYFGDSAGFEGTWQDVSLGIAGMMEMLDRQGQAQSLLYAAAPLSQPDHGRQD
ncbi:low molecular weight protein-tyrosine-phosphatase [Paracoccus sp. KR1-242]|uniref:low molecular weight protein-tyrosine-phosphatase n=1 Tax=Paracoccus sp. KR1-242 TaxID=3410028 RepID=UPI003C0D1D0B